MQYQKEEIRARIIEIARQEFTLNGFQQASLRKIAQRAGMTTGGIYSYFTNKEEIFEQLVKKVVQKWEKYNYYLGLTGFEKNLFFLLEKNNPTVIQSYYNSLFNFVNFYRIDMKLLFFKSQGTQYQNFRQDIAEKAFISVRNTLSRVPSGNGIYYHQISDFFLRKIIDFNLNLVCDMLKDDIALQEILSYEEEMSSFFYSGWKGVIEEYSY